jgi:diacylglycerol kinase family enzyme
VAFSSAKMIAMRHKGGPAVEDTPDKQDGILLLINGAARSGAAEGLRQQIADAMAKMGHAVQIEAPANCDEIEKCARAAVDRGAKLVIAGGGDGTVNAAANALAGTKTALAVVPLGTLNHFAKDTGVPLDIEAAVANAFAGELRKVDVGEVNGRVFVNNSSIGLYPRIVRKREGLQRSGWSKWVALAQAALAVFRRPRVFWIRLRTPKRILSGKTEFVFVGNNEYELTVPQLGARTRLDAGTLWVWQLPHAGRFRAIGIALRAVFGLEEAKAPVAFTAPELRIEMRKRKVEVAIDGEVMIMDTPLTYRSRPRALRVAVPKGHE